MKLFLFQMYLGRFVFEELRFLILFEQMFACNFTAFKKVYISINKQDMKRKFDTCVKLKNTRFSEKRERELVSNFYSILETKIKI